MIDKTNQTSLVALDQLKDQILNAQNIIDQYEQLKKDLKKEMSDACEQVNADQLKWETPNGIKITFSKGHIAVIEKQTEKQFDVEKLKAFYPDIYEKCLVEKQVSVITKNATSDRISITLKGE